ncbi:hypothetical protein [Staphylococcus auricularis]|uniref:Lipoprotein n=1 Tax=Staphylococcus auricularis TaxID=29379 RepID=A0ABX5ICV0_9STAP|nr:hypothetical protein [Staphylococcus auricularis]MCE5038382.1 hypothetical protein [Staphylococcus auricularis]MEB6569098.1 hypothetical protein [Staphylococcus auricularis]PTH15476.1 hypothetical protein BU607_08860 [Staphylococcus auricularis]PTH23893.1 hypothetical protein BU608_10370 [Staphylococcus auricularis]
MKNLIVLTISSLLVLTSCDQSDSEKQQVNKTHSQNKKETKSKSQDMKKENNTTVSQNLTKQYIHDRTEHNNQNNDNSAMKNKESQSTASPTQNDYNQSLQIPDNDESNQQFYNNYAVQREVNQNNMYERNDNQHTENQSQSTHLNSHSAYMTPEEIEEWNRTKPTSHEESQLGYGRVDYEYALEESTPLWEDPNANYDEIHLVRKGEDYDSWARRQAASYGLTY